MPAIFLVSQHAAEMADVGLQDVDGALLAISSAKRSGSNQRSPAAIGTGLFARTSASASMLSGGVGSSIQVEVEARERPASWRSRSAR